MTHARAEEIIRHVRPHLPECPITALELGIKLGKSGNVESIRRVVRGLIHSLNEFYPEKRIGANINGYFLIRDHNDRHADQEFHRNHGKGELFTARTRRHDPKQQEVRV